jgi:hypothetical protein
MTPPTSGTIEITYRGVGGSGYDEIEARFYFSCSQARAQVEEERGVRLRELPHGMWASDPEAVSPAHQEAQERLRRIVEADQMRLLTAVYRAIYGTAPIEEGHDGTGAGSFRNQR